MGYLRRIFPQGRSWDQIEYQHTPRPQAARNTTDETSWSRERMMIGGSIDRRVLEATSAKSRRQRPLVKDLLRQQGRLLMAILARDAATGGHLEYCWAQPITPTEKIKRTCGIIRAYHQYPYMTG